MTLCAKPLGGSLNLVSAIVSSTGFEIERCYDTDLSEASGLPVLVFLREYPYCPYVLLYVSLLAPPSSSEPYFNQLVTLIIILLFIK